MTKTEKIKGSSIETVRNLIAAMQSYALETNWNDSDFIDALVGIGITEDDFKACGFGDYVKEYFEND